jgi:hypothetical protein
MNLPSSAGGVGARAQLAAARPPSMRGSGCRVRWARCRGVRVDARGCRGSEADRAWYRCTACAGRMCFTQAYRRRDATLVRPFFRHLGGPSACRGAGRGRQRVLAARRGQLVVGGAGA